MVNSVGEEFFSKFQNLRQNGKNRALTTLYGKGILRTHKQLKLKRDQMVVKQHSSRERSFSFLQDNIEDIDDPQLKLMPLLKYITKENVIPIIDFENKGQTDLNFILLHVFNCLPSVGTNKEKDFSTVAMGIPSDMNQPISYLSREKLPDVSQVTVSDIKKNLKHRSKRRQLGMI